MATEIQFAPRRLVSLNPADNSVVAEFEVASESDVRAAVGRAREAQPGWGGVGLKGRLGVIRDFQQLLTEQKDSVAKLITLEAGKPLVEAMLTEIVVVLDAARFLLKNAYGLLRAEPLPHGSAIMKAKRGRLVREPYGVIGIISPWNYPFSIPATESLAALVAGNAVVLKPSELTPATAVKLADLLHQAGMPQSVFQVVVGEGPTGAALLDAGIGKAIFTGSVSTGQRVAQAAAERLLPVVLELGGKDAMIVLDDVNVDVVSSAATWGAFVNAGQTCLSVERCYVHRSLYQEFVQACAEKAGKLRVGNGLEPQTDVGPLIHDRQLRIVEEQVNDAVERGARVIAGGRRLEHLGPNFYAPTVITEVNHSMRLMREETFGPVLPIMPFDSDEEAIALANDSEFGLAASVWTRDRRRGESMAARIQAGTVMVNDVLTCFGISEAPHGGVKSSGIGRTHGQMGLEEMTQIKHIDSDMLPSVKKIWWYGYAGDFVEQMHGLVDMLFSRRWRQRLRGALRSWGSLFRPRL